jgi:AraC-like DNA-binding protein
LYSGLNIEQDIIQHENFLCASQTSCEDALAQLTSWIEPNTQLPSYMTTDERIAKAIEFIKQHYNENISVETVAQHVNLSVPRLAQLFKQVTGASIRRFRQWHRIFTTAQKISTGFQITLNSHVLIVNSLAVVLRRQETTPTSKSWHNVHNLTRQGHSFISFDYT